MADRNFYVLTAKADLKDEVELVTFHGPYPDGFEMEVQIEDEQLEADVTLMERLVVEDNEITRLGGPYRPGHDDKVTNFDGCPEGEGCYWIWTTEVNHALVCYVNTLGLLYLPGMPVSYDKTKVTKFKPIPVPSN